MNDLVDKLTRCARRRGIMVEFWVLPDEWNCKRH